MTDVSPAMVSETYRIERAEGTSFTLTLARAAGPEAPSLLVVPAMGMSASYYGKLLAALASSGITAGLMEQRGHEASGGRLPGWGYDFGYADLVEDIALAVDRLTELVPGPAPYLLGHSLGGQAGVAYAADHADALRGLVLVGAPSPHWPSYGRRFLAISQVMGLVGKIVGHFPGKQLRFAGREARTLMFEWSQLARTGRLRVAGRDLGPALAQIQTRVLAISLANDWLAPPGAVDLLTTLMPRAEVTRCHVDHEGVDHFKWARRPESTIDALLGWLAK